MVVGWWLVYCFWDSMITYCFANSLAVLVVVCWVFHLCLQTSNFLKTFIVWLGPQVAMSQNPQNWQELQSHYAIYDSDPTPKATQLYQHSPQTAFQLAKAEICGAEVNAKKTDQWACNINAVGCTMLKKIFTSWCHGPAPQQTTSGQSPEVNTHGGPELAKSRHMADKERTHGGHMVDTHEAGTGGGQGLEVRPNRTRGGHKADKLRGPGQSISRPAFFLLRENQRTPQ